MSDSDKVFAAVCKYVDGDEIDESEARLIASQWHGGQFTALYAFASSGTILPTLEDEITSECPEDQIELRALLDYVENHS